MKGRQVLVILGAVCLLLICAIVGLAIYMIHTVEQERNRLKVKPAMDGRWKPKPEQQQQWPQQEPQETNAKQADEVAPGPDQGGAS